MITAIIYSLCLVSVFYAPALWLLCLIVAYSIYVLVTRRPFIPYPTYTAPSAIALAIVAVVYVSPWLMAVAAAWCIAVSRCEWEGDKKYAR